MAPDTPGTIVIVGGNTGEIRLIAQRCAAAMDVSVDVIEFHIETATASMSNPKLEIQLLDHAIRITASSQRHTDGRALQMRREMAPLSRPQKPRRSLYRRMRDYNARRTQ